MNDYLKEAQRVVGEVAQIFGYMKKFDEMFAQCLSEEIKESLVMETPKAVFTVNELGNVNYDGIINEAVTDVTKIVVPIIVKETIKEEQEKKALDEAIIEAERTLDLNLKIKKQELLNKLLEKK
jgi:hypothetical protein